MTAPSYQLWDLTAGNYSWAYDDEATALIEVRQGMREDRPASFDGVALLRTGAHPDQIHPIAEDAELVALALVATQISPAGACHRQRGLTEAWRERHPTARPEMYLRATRRAGETRLYGIQMSSWIHPAPGHSPVTNACKPSLCRYRR